eukprot:m.235826 g.235826  ORF g.235826 m.235826 type:complete len:104 (+) comp15262_c0_seq12:5039-5350(+)
MSRIDTPTPTVSGLVCQIVVEEADTLSHEDGTRGLSVAVAPTISLQHCGKTTYGQGHSASSLPIKRIQLPQSVSHRFRPTLFRVGGQNFWDRQHKAAVLGAMR